MGVAEDEHFGVLGLNDGAQTVEIHIITVGRRHERILHHSSAVALYYGAEGRIYRRLYHHGVAALREVIHSQGYAFYHAGNETQFVARDGKTVAAQLPVNYRLPIALARFGISEHGVLKALRQSRSNLRANGKIKICNPERSKVVTAKHAVEPFDFHRLRALAVDNIVEIILCHIGYG